MALDFSNLEERIKESGKIQTLDNGVTFISENVPSSGLVSGQIIISAGSAYEKSQDHGIMHFLEHMSFGGSRLYSDRNERNLKSGLIGLDINAQTGPFTVNYPVRGANNSSYLLQQNFSEAFQIVSDMVFFPNIDEESLQREKKVIQRERIESEQRENSPVEKSVRERNWGNNIHLFNGNLGTEDSITRIDTQTLRNYHSRFFVGNNTIVGVVGDLNSGSDLEGVVRENLSEIPSGQKVAPVEILPEKPYNGREVLDFNSYNLKSCDVNLYFQIPPTHSYESNSLALLNYVLGGSFNSLLFQDVREKKGLVYSIGSGIEGHAKTGFLRINYNVAPEYLSYSLQAVDDNLKKLREGSFSETLVDSYKAAYLPKVLFGLQNPGWIFSELFDRYDSERFGFESTGLQRLPLAFDLTKQDVVDVANKYLGEDRLTVVVR